jgi:choline dehydrogenase-like flavoprotein
VVVVAAGGIENARLMLCSNDVNRRGLANDRELVGRFFMDHGYVDIPLGAAAAARNLQFYDSQSAQPIDSARLWAQLVLAQEVRRQERLAGLSLWFQGVPCAALSADAAHTMRRFLSRRASLKQLRTDLRLVLSDPGGVARHALGRNRPGETLRMIAQIEQAPDPENRITLSTELDHVGQPRAQLALRFGAVERSGFLAALRRSTTALGLNGEVLARQAKLLLDAGRFGFFFHHMGTTRMHSDPTRGVVDADCRVHGIANLFIAGSSVFPTAGTAAPTLTIVALALRLADHIRQGRGLRNVP